MNRKILIKQMREKRMTYQEIGNILGITRQRVHQIYKLELNGLDKIREKVRTKDEHTCQICLKKWKKGQRRFDVHHLDEKYEGRSGEKGMYLIDKNNLDRMITLCHKCHLNLDSVKRKMSIGKRFYQQK